MKLSLLHGDCLELMPTLADKSIDLVLTDPPYGTTACKWDSVIPFEPMWKALKRLAKPKAAICLFGSQPFTSSLVMSNPREFRYQWVWDKVNRITGSLTANKIPMRRHEDICVFYKTLPTYNPQMFKKERLKYGWKAGHGRHLESGIERRAPKMETDDHYPQSIIQFTACNHREISGQHPTQKPVDLLRYLIRTYTQEGETVLDFTMGSGSTGVACVLENRNFIGIELDEGYYKIAERRISEAQEKQPRLLQEAA